jgi:hypothetical protein
VPTFQSNPNVNSNIDYGSGLARQLLGGNFSGDLSSLSDLVSYDPRSTQLALASAQGFLTPQYNDIRNQAVQDATNANALNSSTFTDALAKNAFNLESQYQGIANQAALNDLNQAKSNRLNLFQYGGDLLNSQTGLGLQSQGQENQFNLENYQNMVAKTLAGQKSQSGGFLGALTGGAGGALAGIALAPFTGGLSLGLTAALAGGGALAGGLGTAGTGGQLLNAGTGLAGSSLFGSGMPSSISRAVQQTSLPGLYASNNFGLSNPNSAGLSDIYSTLYNRN